MQYEGVRHLLRRSGEIEDHALERCLGRRLSRVQLRKPGGACVVMVVVELAPEEDE